METSGVRKRFINVVLMLFALSLAFMPFSAHALWAGFPFSPPPGPVRVGPVTMCAKEMKVGSKVFSVFVPGKCAPTPAPVPTVDLTANPMAIISGASSTLSWTSANANVCIASNGWTGSKNISGTQSVSPTVTTTYTLACGGAGGTTTDSVTITVNAPPPPAPTLEFNASPDIVTAGATSTLVWNSTNADSCTASGGWSGSKALDGTMDVFPNATTTYTMTCAGAGGSVEASTTVRVILPPPPPPAPTVVLDAEPEIVASGATSTLVWDSTHADSCTASGGWSGVKALDGAFEVFPSATTTYTITCTGAGGSVEASTTVRVMLPPPPPAPTLTLTVNPSSIVEGDDATLTWSSEHADSCVASNGWSGAKALSGSVIVTPTGTTSITYVLSCSGAGGEVTKSVTLTVNPPEPEPEGTLVISEVLYHIGTGQGDTTDNEWVEIFNGTSQPIDMSGYSIHDNNGFDYLPQGTIVAAKSYLWIVASSTTAGLWSEPGDTLTVIVAGNDIAGNGLANGGDKIVLMNAASSTLDMVSWGTNIDAFSPSVHPSPTADDFPGNSITRANHLGDTNTATDWIRNESPNPGE